MVETSEMIFCCVERRVGHSKGSSFEVRRQGVKSKRGSLEGPVKSV